MEPACLTVCQHSTFLHHVHQPCPARSPQLAAPHLERSVWGSCEPSSMHWDHPRPTVYIGATTGDVQLWVLRNG